MMVGQNLRFVLRIGVLLLFLATLWSCNSWGKFWALEFKLVNVNSTPVSNFPVAGPFTADFTVALDAASVTANTAIGSSVCVGSVQVSLDNFATCLSLKAPVLSNGDTRLTITPLPFMKPVSTYRFRLTTGLKSYQGIALDGDFTSSTYTTKDIGKWVFAVQFTSAQIHYATLSQVDGTLGTFAQTTNPTIAIPLAIDPSGRVLASSHNTGTNLYYSSINQTTGVPSAGLSYADGTFNHGLVFHPTLPTLYGAAADGTIRQYTVNMASGAPLSSTNLALAGSAPKGIGIHPNGKYAYVSSDTDNKIHVVQIDQNNGSLIGVVGATSTGGGFPRTPVIEATGKFLYSANNSVSTMSYYAIDQTSGLLTNLGAVSVGSNAQGAVVDPTGRFVYIVNTGADSVSVFSLNSNTGFPSLVQTVATGNNSPTFVAIEGSARFALVSHGSTGNIVISYSIDQQTGALTVINSRAAINAQGLAVY